MVPQIGASTQRIRQRRFTTVAKQDVGVIMLNYVPSNSPLNRTESMNWHKDMMTGITLRLNGSANCASRDPTTTEIRLIAPGEWVALRVTGCCGHISVYI